MSEEEKEPTKGHAGAGAPEVAATAGKRPGTKLPPHVALIAVVVLSLAAGAGVGSALLAPPLVRARQAAANAAAHPDKKDKKNDKKGEAGKPTVYKLDNIIVNPSGSQGERFLMCSVAIESDDPKALDLLRAHEIELRDKVVTLLSRQTMDRLTSQGARDSIRADLLLTIRPVLGTDAPDAELHVYLPQFVVQ